MQGDERARRSPGLVAAMETALCFVKTVPLLHSTWATADGQELEGYQRETELSGFRERAGEIAMSVPLLSPPPTQQAGRCHLSFVVPFYQMAESKSALTC